MSGFSAIDLSRLPAPEIIQPLDYEAILADMIAQLKVFMPSFDATVESDPAVKILQLMAYRELLQRADNNDRARGVMVAFATGADLDHLAALFGVARFELEPADIEAGTPAVMESDDDFRRRITLAPEGYSVAGPEGAYIFHALSADPDVLDASATSPDPGEVLVTILSRTGDGAAPGGLVDTVEAYLTADTRRPMTDAVTVQSAEIVPYAVTATITTFAGPDPAIVRGEALARVTDLVARSRRLGRDITRATLFGAIAGVEGVQNATITAPAADIVLDRTQCGHCTAITVTLAGTAE